MNTLNFIAVIISAVMIFSMAVFSLTANPRDQLNRSIFYLLLSTVFIIIIYYLLYSYPDSKYLVYFARTYFMFIILFCFFFLYLSFFFPRAGVKFANYVELLYIFFALFFGGLAGFTNLVIDKAYFSQNILIREFGIVYYVYTGAGGISIGISLLNLIIKYIKTEANIIKLKLRYYIFGVYLGGVFLAFSVLILPDYINYYGLFQIGHPIAAVFFVAPLFYTAMYWNVIEFSSMISRGLLSIILFLLIFAPVFGTLYLYYNNIWIVSGVPNYLIATGLGIIFLIMNYFLQPRIISLFSLRLRRFDAQIDKFLKETERLISAEYIIQKTADILFDGLALNRVFFLWFIDKTRKYELLYYRSSEPGEDLAMEPIDRSAMIIRWFARNHVALSRDKIYTDVEQFENIKDDMLNFYETNDIEVILPIFHERMLYGLICLGVKERSLTYSHDEMQKLNLFHEKCNDIISTIFFYQKSMKEQFATRTKELSSEILTKSLPAGLPGFSNIRFGSFIIPRYEEGADYFDFLNTGDRGIGILATDVSGVGINSALYSVMLRSAFQSCILESSMTNMVVQILNRVIFDYSGGKGNLVTAFYLFYDFDNMRLMYTNAGFPSLELYRVSRSDFDSLDTEGIPLGFDGAAPFGIGRTNVSKDDIGILFSKSFLSSKNEEGAEFGLLRLRNIVRENRTRRPSEISEAVYNSYREFMGISLPESDVFVLIFKIS